MLSQLAGSPPTGAEKERNGIVLENCLRPSVFEATPLPKKHPQDCWSILHVEVAPSPPFKALLRFPLSCLER